MCPLQFLTNRGIGTIAPPYQITIRNDNYYYVASAWNWQLKSFNDHTVSGEADQVSRLQSQVAMYRSAHVYVSLRLCSVASRLHTQCILSPRSVRFLWMQELC